MRLDAEHRPQHRRAISIHAPQWGATFEILATEVKPTIFQSTHPSGVRQKRNDLIVCRYTFQSTHPSGVRHAHHGHAHRPRRISIHAPQWGATRGRMRHVRHRAISIHAPQWGATSADGLPCGAAKLFQSTHPSGVRPSFRVPLTARDLDFNPRTPVGCDHRRSGRLVEQPPISIHAPQWGATGATCTALGGISEFQSTHPSGVRHETPPDVEPVCEFQSTHPSGVRLHALHVRVRGSRFQSTHPSGVRPSFGQSGSALYLVKSVFRVSSLIFFGFRHEECRPVVCFTGCPSCRT